MGGGPLKSDRVFDVIEASRSWLEALMVRLANVSLEDRAFLAEVVQEISSNLEEVNVLGEELKSQNDELLSTRQAMEKQRQRYQDLFQMAPDGYLVTDPKGNIEEANCAAATMLGVDAASLIGKPLLAFVSDHDHRDFLRKLAALEGGAAARVYDWEMAIRPREKPPLSALVNVAVGREADGRPVSLRWVLHDLSALRRSQDALRSTEEQLRQSQKIEAIGRLAGGVAHDFNNMMTAVLGYASRLLDKLSEDDPRRAEVEEIERAGERAARLTRQLLAFGRKQVLRPEKLCLNSVIENLSPMLARLLGEDIRLETSLIPSLGTVEADRSQLEQVIMNLAVNARDAMPRGGTLAIATANEDLDAAAAAGWQDIAPGPYVRLSVVDTGEGMNEEVLGHLFEPFFTTKGVGEGTGLGLSTVYGIVKQSGGDIRVRSAPGQGASFDLLFPCQGRPAAAASGERKPAEEPAAEPSGGTETILIVEDEDMVRGLTVLELQDLGYTVLEAADAGDALRLARETERLDLVLSDVVLPGMSGQTIVGLVRQKRPDLKVLFMSGYGEKLVAQHGGLPPGVQFIEKPFTPEGLARKVREVLDGS